MSKFQILTFLRSNFVVQKKDKQNLGKLIESEDKKMNLSKFI